MDDESFEHIKSLGVSHIWYTGIPRHATDPSFIKGNAGSPYAISDWYDVNPYMADNQEHRMDEFEDLVKRTHKADLKVITDFIPNHVARDYKGDIPVYDHCDYDWTDTLKINYDAAGTWERMKEIVLFWAGKGVDGMRCDMVELVPFGFLKWLIHEVKNIYPAFIFIGEVYNRDNYRVYLKEIGFDLLYDKSGMYDSLMSIIKHSDTARRLTWNWQYLNDLQPSLLNFLENHDEVRFASDEFGGKAGRCFAALAAAALFNNASFMIYFGEETGVGAGKEDNFRTSIFDWGEVPVLDMAKSNDFLLKFKKITKLASSDCFSKGQSYDLCYCNMGSEGFNPDRHFVFLRHLGDETWLVLCNFSDSESKVKVVIPQHAIDLLGIKKAIPEDGLYVSAAANDAAIIRI